jgi:ankyrin repeat protein
VDKNGDTPLSIACMFEHEDVVRLLLRHGAGIETPNGKGATPLWVGPVA